MDVFGSTGLCYGILGDELPRPEDVLTHLLSQYNLKRIRLYSPNSSILDVLKEKKVEVMLGVPNDELKHLAGKPDNANKWVLEHVESYTDIIKYIVVGNDVNPSNTPADVHEKVYPAMLELQGAIDSSGHRGKIIVSTALGGGVVVGDGVHPSETSFKSEFLEYLGPILDFLADNNAPLLFNVHPYHHLLKNQNVSIDYATFEASGTVVHDGPVGYQNLFDAIVDSVHWALLRTFEAFNVKNRKLKIVVSETGWPTDGGPHADKKHASSYIWKLISHVDKGTPMRPREAIETYIVSLFDENNKPGFKYERHWGTFHANGNPKYPLTPKIK